MRRDGLEGLLIISSGARGRLGFISFMLIHQQDPVPSPQMAPFDPPKQIGSGVGDVSQCPGGSSLCSNCTGVVLSQKEQALTLCDCWDIAAAKPRAASEIGVFSPCESPSAGSLGR